jgi:hypothetical protein
MPTFRGALLQDGQPLLQDVTLTLVDMNTGIRPAWRGSLSCPGEELLEGVPYELKLEDGRTLSITLDTIQRSGNRDCYATFIGSGDLHGPEEAP